MHEQYARLIRVLRRAAVWPVITLTQPWATLLLIGAKKIETRSWLTRHHGPMWIHAGAGLAGHRVADLRSLCQRPEFAEPLARAGYSGFDALPRGQVLGVGWLAHFQQFELAAFDAYDRRLIPGRDHELAYGDFTPGRYGWHFTSMMKLARPVPARGALQCWDLRPATPKYTDAELINGLAPSWQLEGARESTTAKSMADCGQG